MHDKDLSYCKINQWVLMQSSKKKPLIYAMGWVVAPNKTHLSLNSQNLLCDKIVNHMPKEKQCNYIKDFERS